MASQMVGQSEPARDCLPQAGPDGPMVVEHLGTVPHELCRELLLEMGDGRTRSGDTYRLFVGGAPTAWWSSLHREPPSAVGSTSDDSPPAAGRDGDARPVQRRPGFPGHGAGRGHPHLRRPSAGLVAATTLPLVGHRYRKTSSSSDVTTWSAADMSTTAHCGTAMTVRPAALAAAIPDPESSRPTAADGSTPSRRHASR